MSARSAIRGGVVGNYVDQLHIFLPMVALAPAMATLAGPHAAVTGTAYAIVALLLGRPVGAVIFGRIADRLGRTHTTEIAILGTALCSLAVAALPTHEVLGAWTLLALLVLRFLGGVFIAGEYSAAIPLAMEWSRPRQRGLVSGLIMSMAPWAQATIALATLGLLAALGTDAYAAWGWRAAFAAGGAASLAMLVYYRRHVSDARIVARAAVDADPAGAHPVSAFWRLFGLMSGLWLLTNSTVILLAARLRTDGGLTAREVSLAMACAAIAQAVVMGLTGHLSTLTGRRRFFIGYGLLGAAVGPVLWTWLMSGPPVAAVAAGAALLQVVTVCAYGPVGAYLSEQFPPGVRSTGYGAAYSLSIIVPALHPLWLPWLEPLLGRDGPVVAMIALGGALVAWFGAFGPDLVPEEMAGQSTSTPTSPAPFSAIGHDRPTAGTHG
ncbi:MFS transporter [Actinomycetota bacterium]